VVGFVCACHAPLPRGWLHLVQKNKTSASPCEQQPCQLTGDNQATANAVAKQVGILGNHITLASMRGMAASSNSLSLTAAQFDSLSPERQMDAVLELRVLARVEPHHKQRLIELLQEHREVRSKSVVQECSVHPSGCPRACVEWRARTAHALLRCPYVRALAGMPKQRVLFRLLYLWTLLDHYAMRATLSAVNVHPSHCTFIAKTAASNQWQCVQFIPCGARQFHRRP
jgi:hypothetical protein